MSSIARKTILKTHRIEQYLTGRNIKPIRSTGERKCYRCPFHQEKDGSFFVYDHGDYDDYHCFGCLENNELIWTESGLIPIGQVVLGHKVIGIDGKLHTIVEIRKDRKPLKELRLAAFQDPLLLTADHRCIVLDKTIAIQNLPYLHERKSNALSHADMRYSNKLRSLPSYGDRIYFTEKRTLDIRRGDFFAFPVIPFSERKSKDLYARMACRTYKSGPSPKKVILKANKDLAFLYGLYLAEGSISGRTFRLTMHKNEKSILEKAQKILKVNLNLNSSIFVVDGKSISELICSSTDLIDQIEFFFGKGCENKQIPSDVLYWPDVLQRSLIDGYLLGDGSKNRKNSISVSKKLTYGLFGLSIQCGLLPCVSDRRKSNQKDGSKRKDHWVITYRQNQGINAFYEDVGNNRYFFSRIESIYDGTINDVTDIGVSGPESFTTKMGVVHNCKAHGDIITLVAKLEDISYKDAITKLSDGLKIDLQSELDSIVREIILLQNDPLASMDPLDLSFFISHICYEYLVKVEFDPEEVACCEKLFIAVDKMVYSLDVKNLDDVHESIRSTLSKRIEMFRQKQMQKRLEALKSSEAYRNIL